MNEPTDMYVPCLLYLKMRDVYQMTLVLSSNDNDGYWHYYQVSSPPPTHVRLTLFTALHAKQKCTTQQW